MAKGFSASFVFGLWFLCLGVRQVIWHHIGNMSHSTASVALVPHYCHSRGFTLFGSAEAYVVVTR